MSLNEGFKSDISELVTELTLKLDELEERSVRRTQNVALIFPSTTSSNGASTDATTHATSRENRESENEIWYLPNPAGPLATDPNDMDFPKRVDEYMAIDKAKLCEIMTVYGLIESQETPNDQEFKDLFNDLSKFLGLTVRKV